MPRKSTSSEKLRFSFSVPIADSLVAEWCKNQDNLSMSLRMLIKSDAVSHGVSDVFCRQIQGSKRGRPSADSFAMRETVTHMQNESSRSDENEMYHDETPAEPKPQPKTATAAYTQEKPKPAPVKEPVAKPPADVDDGLLDEDGFVDDPSAILGF